jgi:hypothetical protein
MDIHNAWNGWGEGEEPRKARQEIYAAAQHTESYASSFIMAAVTSGMEGVPSTEIIFGPLSCLK